MGVEGSARRSPRELTGTTRLHLDSGTPGSPSWRKQPGIPAPPHDLLLWNNSTEGLENGTSCERRPALDVCPPVASEFAAGITLGSPFPTGGLFFT